jgi:hypothetical protein
VNNVIAYAPLVVLVIGVIYFILRSQRKRFAKAGKAKIEGFKSFTLIKFWFAYLKAERSNIVPGRMFLLQKRVDRLFDKSKNRRLAMHIDPATQKRFLDDSDIDYDDAKAKIASIFHIDSELFIERDDNLYIPLGRLWQLMKTRYLDYVDAIIDGDGDDELEKKLFKKIELPFSLLEMYYRDDNDKND